MKRLYLLQDSIPSSHGETIYLHAVGNLFISFYSIQLFKKNEEEEEEAFFSKSNHYQCLF